MHAGGGGAEEATPTAATSKFTEHWLASLTTNADGAPSSTHRDPTPHTSLHCPSHPHSAVHASAHNSKQMHTHSTCDLVHGDANDQLVWHGQHDLGAGPCTAQHSTAFPTHPRQFVSGT